MDIEQLKAAAAEYLNTVNNKNKDEWYTTDYHIHKTGIDGLLEWLDEDVYVLVENSKQQTWDVFANKARKKSEGPDRWVASFPTQAAAQDYTSLLKASK